VSNQSRIVESRGKAFVTRPSTNIWEECPSKDNPYLTETVRCRGYSLLELMEKCNYLEVFFLLFHGEIPAPDQIQLLEKLMIALINPGPRHPATRAVMVSGASKTSPANFLPVSLSILSGSYLGANEVQLSMRFLKEHLDQNPEDVANKKFTQEKNKLSDHFHPAPGFGTRFGGVDPFTTQVADQLGKCAGAGNALEWGGRFVEALRPHGHSWLNTGLAAAVFLDLGFSENTGPGLFQILSAPGLVAHGAEFSEKPMTAMPFPKDDEYVIEQD